MVTLRKLPLAIVILIVSMAIFGVVFLNLHWFAEAVHAHTKHSLSDLSLTHSASILYGEAQALGNGSMRTWVKLNSDGTPSDIGISFTEAALSGLPKESDDFGEYPLKIKLLDGIGFSTFEYELPLPKGAEAKPFTHVSLNWNPHGHGPKGIYTPPHLDFHFNLISAEKRHAILAANDDDFFEKAYRMPLMGLIPQGYLAPPRAAEHRMGLHWVDFDGHEFHGEGWEKSFIYGSYDGEMVFWEPMISNSFLNKKLNTTAAIKQPQVYPKSGYYPTAYSVNYANGEYSVSLNGLTFRSSKLASVP